jgi:hypothetical protein
VATLIVGGVTVPVAAGVEQTEKNEPIGGEIVRMFDGTARSTVRGYKRIWNFTTRLMLAADAATLKTALLTTALPVACSGDITGAVNAIPRITEYTPVRAHGTVRRRVVFTLTEV